MPSPSNFTGSVWFVSLVALLASLGAQVLIGSIVPIAAFDWLDGQSRQGPIMLVAGETSFWRGDAFIRALSFGIGALLACLLARSQSWGLVAILLAISATCTVFAQFPRPASFSQLVVWGISAPISALTVGAIFKLVKGNA